MSDRVPLEWSASSEQESKRTYYAFFDAPRGRLMYTASNRFGDGWSAMCGYVRVDDTAPMSFRVGYAASPENARAMCELHARIKQLEAEESK